MKHKPFDISKQLVWEAWKRVKTAKGGPGIDNISLETYELKLGSNLYKLWNRMSSGSYFPKPVKQVAIPKSKGVRLLGIPTVEDRVAQTTVRLKLERELEKVFLPESYGARPRRSTHEAIEACRQGCWSYDWVIDLDLKSYFDTIDHALLMKAVRKHAKTQWETLYIERWLNAPIATVSGELQEKQGKGIPQGATISPLLSNLFLHYALDTWIKRNIDNIQFERFLDDCVIHCKTKKQACYILDKVIERLNQVGLEINKDKTSIVLCLNKHRRKRWGDVPKVKFTFLGYDFKPRNSIKPNGEKYLGFSPAVGSKAQKKLLRVLKEKRFFKKTQTKLEDIARLANPIIRGWTNYFGVFRPSEMTLILHRVNKIIVAWMKSKYKISVRRAQKLLKRWVKKKPELFHHWKLGYTK